MLIHATTRLRAAYANEEKAVEFLKSLGFKNLRVKSAQDELISFVYKTVDRKLLEQHLGEPKKTGLNDLYWKFGVSGFVILKPLVNVVALKNAGKNGLTTQPVVTHVPVDTPVEPKKDSDVNLPGSHDNDDAKVPHVGVPMNIERQYQYAQGEDTKSFRLKVMSQLWDYFNKHKFGGLMKQPRLGLMKNVAGEKLRVRGRWWAYKRLLEVSPRLFNAHFSFFVEIFLHEMCHQAVSEIDRVQDNTEQGHGPNWQTWMRKVGLNPRRFDPNDNSTYMTYQEKQAVLQKKAEHQEKLEKLQEKLPSIDLKYVHVQNNMPCTVKWNNDIYNGMLICATTRKGDKWAFVKEGGEYGTAHLIVSYSQIFAYAGPKPPEYFKSIAWQTCASKIHSYYENKMYR